MKPIQIIQSINEWETLKQTIPAHGLIIFKFSPICPISKRIERKFDEWYTQLNDGIMLHCAKVDVIESRELSQFFARTFRIQHESPQAIWLTPEGSVHWYASHRSIFPEALATQLANIAGQRG